MKQIQMSEKYSFAGPPNHRDEDGKTALYLAAEKNRLQVGLSSVLWLGIQLTKSVPKFMPQLMLRFMPNFVPKIHFHHILIQVDTKLMPDFVPEIFHFFNISQVEWPVHTGTLMK